MPPRHNATSHASTHAPSVAARSLSAFVFYALLVLLPLAAMPYASVEPWWTALFDAVVFVLAAPWAIEGALSGRWVTRAHTLLVPCLGLAALAFLQSLSLPVVGVVSFDPYESRVFALRLLAFTLYAAMLLRYATTERRLRALVVVVVCVGVASALFGLFRQASQREQLGFVLPLLQKGEGYAQFVSKNHFAYLAEMSLGLAAGLATYYGRGRGASRGKLLLCAAAALLLWASLVLSRSRGGVFAMLCQAFFISIAYGWTSDKGRVGRTAATLPRTAAARVALASLLIVLIVLGTVWVGGDPLAERMGAVGEEVAAADAARVERPAIWADTLRLAAQHPLAGVGLGGYWIAIRETHGGSGVMVPRQAHNDYLELFASAGLIGALLLAAFLFLFVVRVRERVRVGTPFARAVILGALAGLFGVAVHSLVDFGLHVTANAFVCAALVASATAEVPDGARAGAKN
ncbi:MAG TPA: O-antigen ligase family protein [Pyrinomonadaceae bacterium]